MVMVEDKAGGPGYNKVMEHYVSLEKLPGSYIRCEGPKEPHPAPQGQSSLGHTTCQ